MKEARVQISLSAPTLLSEKAKLARFRTQSIHSACSKPALNDEIGPLQLIATASRAALELAEAGDLEPALKILNQLAQIWGPLIFDAKDNGRQCTGGLNTHCTLP